MEQFSDAERYWGGVVGLPTERSGYDMKVGLVFQLVKNQTPQTCHFFKEVGCGLKK